MKELRELPAGVPPLEKLGEEDCRKGYPSIIGPSSFRVRHLQIPKTLGTRTLQKGIPGKGRRWTQRGRRCPVLGIPSERRGSRRGRGGGGSGQPRGEEGRCAIAGSLCSSALPSLSLRGLTSIRVHYAEARPLQGEAPTRRGAGSPTEQ